MLCIYIILSLPFDTYVSKQEPPLLVKGLLEGNVRNSKFVLDDLLYTAHENGDEKKSEIQTYPAERHGAVHTQIHDNTQ